jgi:hypothetical protein
VESDLATLSSTIRAIDPRHPIFGAETWDSVNNATESQLAGFLDPIKADGTTTGIRWQTISGATSSLPSIHSNSESLWI